MPNSTPVRIELTSSWDGEQVEHLYEGELYRKGSSVYVRYTETDETEGETRTLVKLSEHEIKIMRRGHVESEHTFSLQERRRGHYRTDMGTLPIVTDTLALDVQLREGLCIAVWTYSLYIAEEPAGLFSLKLHIREERV